ncbi:DNA cytosine methyltransferase [Bacillus altitudinis]|uniref:DNA cytosine methyltransferase n=1 Tax=Bacillus altitudinis TaxID=293387 RepID=UPI003F7C24DE
MFCGPGGLSLGAKEAVVLDENGQVVLDENGEEYKVVHAWANDFHEDTCKTFRLNIVGNDEDTVTVKHGDVKELDIKSLPPIDFFAFGFPCNDFSLVGETKGLDGKYGGLYRYGIKLLNHHQPSVFVAENVGGLEGANEGKAFVQILKAIEEAGEFGYNIIPHKYRFEEYGVPQARHRIIIVGIRKDLGLRFQVPKAPFKNKEQWMTAKEALESEPIEKDALNHEFTNHHPKVVKMLDDIFPGG